MFQKSHSNVVWNPGGAWNPTIDVPERILTLISSMESAGELDGGKVSSRTELKSRANMPVDGRNAVKRLMRALSLSIMNRLHCQWWTLPSSTSLYDERGWYTGQRYAQNTS
jgi:hypothetical protein